MNFIDPTGHRVCEELDEYHNCTAKGPSGYGTGSIGRDLKKDKPIDKMKPGDIITFETTVNGEVVTHNYRLGVLEDNTRAFWDLDSHDYIEYALTVSMVDGANTWTTFRKTDPKTFNSYEVMASSSTPASLPEFDVSWTGGMDNKPGYVEIKTKVDWENVPTVFAWAIFGPGLVASFWMDAKPTITPLSQGGYYPLSNYIFAWSYLASDGAALERYPVIHP